MAGSLTDAAEKLVIDALNGVAAFAPTLPLQVALITITTPSTDSAAGSEVVPGANAYARQNMTMGAAAGTNPTTASNSNAQTWANMPPCTLGGFEIWDSNAVPKRLWYGTFSAPRVVNAGDTFQIGIGQLSLTGD